MEKQLIRRFKDTFTGVPTWAWPFKPSIPLVGKKYQPGKGLLIYASAENLSRFRTKPVPERFTSEKVWNRYRACYEDAGNSRFLPNVGIQPMTDGGLFAAGLFIADKYKLPERVKPRLFLETIAVTNWCKFSIKSVNNKDYLSDLKKLTESLPFVIGELVVLQPKIVLIPKTIWRHSILQAAMRGASPKTLFLPVPQFNATVVNTQLKKHNRSAVQLKNKLAGTTLTFWMENLYGFNTNNAWRYIAALCTK